MVNRLRPGSLLCTWPVPSSGYLPWSFPPLLPCSLAPLLPCYLARFLHCSLPSSLNPSSARFLPPVFPSRRPCLGPSLPRSFPSATLPPSNVPSSTDALSLPIIIASSLHHLPASLPPCLPASLPPSLAVKCRAVTFSERTPTTNPFWRIVKNPTIDMCNVYDRSTVDARTFSWVSAAIPRAF